MSPWYDDDSDEPFPWEQKRLSAEQRKEAGRHANQPGTNEPRPTLPVFDSPEGYHEQGVDFNALWPPMTHEQIKQTEKAWEKAWGKYEGMGPTVVVALAALFGFTAWIGSAMAFILGSIMVGGFLGLVWLMHRDTKDL
jgi:hypothetical protein